MPQMGVVRAEGQSTSSVLGTDTFVVQRQLSGNSYKQPFEATVSELFGGSTVLAVGTATLTAGTATVALSSITSSSKVFLTPAAASPNAMGYVITAGTNFVIHSSSGADTSTVSYMVLS